VPTYVDCRAATCTRRPGGPVTCALGGPAPGGYGDRERVTGATCSVVPARTTTSDEEEEP